MALAQRFQQHPRPRSSIERCISLAGGPAHGKGGFAHHFAITPGPALTLSPHPHPSGPIAPAEHRRPPGCHCRSQRGLQRPPGPGLGFMPLPRCEDGGVGGEREICAIFIFFAIFLFLLFCNSPLPPIPSSSSASQ